MIRYNSQWLPVEFSDWEIKQALASRVEDAKYMDQDQIEECVDELDKWLRFFNLSLIDLAFIIKENNHETI